MSDNGSDESWDETDQQEVVAYLDGELEENVAERLRQKMQSSSKVRENAEDLRETWDLLDLLDAPPADPSLKTRTLELAPLEDLATDAWPTSGVTLSPRDRVLRWTGLVAWLAALVGCFALGWALRRPRPAPPEDHRINQNRPLYENFPLLEKVRSRAFLEKWSDPDQTQADED